MEEKTQEETIDISPENNEVNPIEEIDSDYNSFKSPIMARADDPTNNPQTFKEQFCIKTDGTLEINANGTWTKIGGGNSASGYEHYTSGGVKTITCGFAPTTIKITAFNDSAGVRYSIGQYTSTGQSCIFLTTNWHYLPGYIAYVMDGSGAEINGGAVNAITSTGFSINWFDYVSGTTDLIWEAYG